MRRYIHSGIFSLVLILAYTFADAQVGEQVRPLMCNEVLIKKAKEIRRKRAARPKMQPPMGNIGVTGIASHPLHVPFFDDFANDSSAYPNDTLWMDSCVYINNTMAILPPSIGVATFDGLNKWGYPYNIHDDSNGNPCDTLTSRPIDLSAEKHDTLRFFLQKGGNGEPPNGDNGNGIADSFIVEFSDTGSYWKLDSNTSQYYLVHDTFWIHGWDTVGNDTSSAFFIVKVAIPATHGDTNFYRSNFQFRFRSVGNPSGNLDIWNLDYVRLDNLPENNKDLAMYFPAKSLLNTYYSMPWNVFSNSNSLNNLTSPTVSLYMKNNDDTIGGRYVSYGYRITDAVSKKVLVNSTGLARNLNPLQDTVINLPNPIDYTKVTASKDTMAHLIIKTGISASPDQHLRNDTAATTQDFDDYFAYDDGTAELGYGINGVPGGVAVQFTDPSQQSHHDSIWAIGVHFNAGEDPNDVNTNEKFFNLKIWSQINTGGNDNNDEKYVLYEWDGEQPHITDTLNGYTIYVLDAPVAVPTSKLFYVGWTQSTIFWLNVGYDANYNLIDNDSPNVNVLYDVSGSWQTSSLSGTPMIRAFVSTIPVKYYDIKPTKKPTDGYSIYPNPSAGIYNIQLYNEGKYQLQLYNITGQMIDQQNVSTQQSTIDYSKFANGMYILRVVNKGTGNVTNKTIVISK